MLSRRLDGAFSESISPRCIEPTWKRGGFIRLRQDTMELATGSFIERKKKIMKKSLSKLGKRLVLICGLLCLIFGISLSCAAGERAPAENEVFAIGTGKIFSGNVASAKKSAISQALMKGVESYIVRRLGGQNIVNSFERILQEILPTAEEDVENFNILAECQIGEKYQVLVKMKINEKVFNKRLSEAGLIVTEGPPTKLLFMVSETRNTGSSYWWKDPEIYSALNPTELALHKAFQKRGFSPINRTLYMPETGFEGDMRIVDLEDSNILRWGRLFNADVVIFGRTEILEDRGVSLTLRVFEVNREMEILQDMQIETTDKDLETQEAIMKALESLADKLAERFAPAITELSRDQIQKLEITLMGLSSYKQLNVFTDFLRKQVLGVQSVRQVRVRKDSITIEVEFQGDRYRFLDSVLNHENLPFPLNLAETQEGNILLKLESGGW